MNRLKYLIAVFLLTSMLYKLSGGESKYTLKIIPDFKILSVDDDIVELISQDIYQCLNLGYNPYNVKSVIIKDSLIFSIYKKTVKPSTISEYFKIIDIRQENNNIIGNLETKRSKLYLKRQNKTFVDSKFNILDSILVNKFFNVNVDSALISFSQNQLSVNSYILSLYDRKLSGLTNMFSSKTNHDIICEKIEFQEKENSPFKIDSYFFDGDQNMILRTSIKDDYVVQINFNTFINKLDSINDILVDNNKLKLMFDGKEIDFSDDKFIAFNTIPYIYTVHVDSNESIDFKFTSTPQESLKEPLSVGDRFFQYFFDVNFTEHDFKFEQPRGYKLNDAHPDSSNYEYSQNGYFADLRFFELEPLVAFYIDLSKGKLSNKKIKEIVKSVKNKDNIFLFMTNGEDVRVGEYEKLKLLRNFDPIKTPNTFMSMLSNFQDQVNKFEFKSGIPTLRRNYIVSIILSTSTLSYNLKDASYNKTKQDKFSKIISNIKNNLRVSKMSLFYPDNYTKGIYFIDKLNYVKK